MANSRVTPRTGKIMSLDDIACFQKSKTIIEIRLVDKPRSRPPRTANDNQLIGFPIFICGIFKQSKIYLVDRTREKVNSRPSSVCQSKIFFSFHKDFLNRVYQEGSHTKALKKFQFFLFQRHRLRV